MMTVSIVCVGKIKESFFREAVSEYEKRLRRYCHLQITEVADEPTPDHASAAQEEQIRRKEGQRILSALTDVGGYVIALAVQAREEDSVAFSQKLSRLGNEGKSHIYFIIGGSLGLSKEVLSRADESLSFSPMTFPHQLMRVILLEQIYRAYRIMKGEPYHK